MLLLRPTKAYVNFLSLVSSVAFVLMVPSSVPLLYWSFTSGSAAPVKPWICPMMTFLTSEATCHTLQVAVNVWVPYKNQFVFSGLGAFGLINSRSSLRG